MIIPIQNEDKHQFLKELRDIFLQSSYFCDLLLNHPDKKILDDYLFFQDKKHYVFASLSLDNQWNIYGQNIKALTQMFEYISNNTNQGLPQMIVGPKGLENIVFKFFKNHITKKNPYYCMHSSQKKTQPIDIQRNFKSRLAKVDDYPLVESWYNAFNEDQKSNWTVPSIEMMKKDEFHLLFDNSNTFIGACQTVQSKKRFWLSKQFIFPKYRHRGWGTIFTQLLMNKAALNNKKLSLLVSSSNSKAVQMYKNLSLSTLGENCTWELSK